jgi:hypothetical protein
MIGGIIEQKQLHFFMFVKFNSLTVKILFTSFLEPSKVTEILYKRNQKGDNLVNGIGVNKTARRNCSNEPFLKDNGIFFY